MNRTAGVLVGLACILACWSPGCAQRDPGPNVIVIVVDTLRADRLPFYGFDRGETPFLSSLAGRSVVFESAWAASSWTAPSTASIFTGVYPNQHGVLLGLNAYKRQKNKGNVLELNRIPASLETLPKLMKSVGYRTIGLADNPTIGQEIGFDRGFDEFKTFDYATADVVNMAVELKERQLKDGGRYFLYLHYMDPHAPYHPQRPWFPGDVYDYGRLRNGDKTEYWLDAYDSEISYLDRKLAELFEALEVGEDTVVLLTADHGEEFQDHGGYLHEFKLYSELTRIPLLVYHPGVAPRRRRVQAHVSHIDLLPTLREILGLAPSDQYSGRSLVPYYLGDEPGGSERAVFAMRDRPGLKRLASVVQGRYKYIVSLYDAEEELYDLVDDPHEQNDLSERLPDVVMRMRDLWREFDTSARRWESEATRVELSPDRLDALNRLGYGGEDGEPSDD